jgi:hypothetical protein
MKQTGTNKILRHCFISRAFSRGGSLGRSRTPNVDAYIRESAELLSRFNCTLKKLTHLRTVKTLKRPAVTEYTNWL